MATASLRRRAGMLEIKNKERKMKEELKNRDSSKQTEEVSEEEHNKRMEMLKRMGVV